MPLTEQRLCFVRHCLTDFDVADHTGRFCGRSDPPLNARGTLEAHALGRLLRSVPFDRAYCGTARRCRETLHALLSDRLLPMVEDSRLNEIDYGLWDGLTKGEIQARYPEQWTAFEADPAGAVPAGGEPVERCLNRAREWLAECDSRLGLVVVDKTWLRLLVCSLMCAPLTEYRRALDAKIGGVTSTLLTASGWRIEALNYAATAKRVFGSAVTDV